MIDVGVVEPIEVRFMQSMNTVLRLFGNYLKVDRCYIAQTGDEGEHYSVTYEWAMEV